MARVLAKETIQKQQSAEACRLECGRNGNPARILHVPNHPIIDRPGVVTDAVRVVREETRRAPMERDPGERRGLHKLLGRSSPMRKVFSLLEALVGVESTVLITGESGTGKELAAEALHYLGPRRDKPFVKVNCSALSSSLLESELFGHVRGAFTGAVTTRIGRFQLADGGTIFIDEIGDLPSNTQSCLLRVLQEKEFERVGDSAPIKTNARIMSATNKDLRRMVSRREFREDLLYRLDVVEVHMPPLRERREDIPLLMEHFLWEFSQKLQKRIVAITSDVENLFMKHSWPGNVRELEHALEHACVLCDQNVITMDFLPNHLKEGTSSELFPSSGRPALDQRSILMALEQTAGNKMRAARLLGINRKTLYRNLAKYNLADIA